MLFTQFKPSETKVYVPSPSLISEIDFRVDMKDGCWKLGPKPLYDENNHSVSLSFIPLALTEWFGNIGQSELYKWYKLLFIPLTEHPLIKFASPTVCSVFLRGDAYYNLKFAQSLAPAQGVDMSCCVVETKFLLTEKAPEGVGKVTTKPPDFMFRNPAKSEDAIAKIVQKESQAIESKIIDLSEYNSGKTIVRLPEGQDHAVIVSAFVDAHTGRLNGNQVAYLSAADEDTNDVMP
jgi:hypothetical protein